jgi:Undecaprenyl-phosphate glucose phosphotransferase
MVLILIRYHFLLRLCIYTLPLTAFTAAAALVPGFQYRAYESSVHILLIATTVAVWGMSAEHYKVCSVDELFRAWASVRHVFPACISTYLIIIAIVFFLDDVGISRALLLLSAILLFAYTLIVHRIFRSLLRRGTHTGKPLRVLIVGTDGFAEQAVYRLRHMPLPCQIAGYVHVPGQSIQVADAPIHEMDELEELDLGGVNDIVIAVGPGHAFELPKVIAVAERFCTPIRAIINFGENVLVRERLFEFGRLQLLDLARSPAESLAYAIAKRAFDIAFACLTILVSSPLMLAIAVGIKLTSRGPVFFRQERVGLNGQIFSMLKFRSMNSAPTAESDTRWTVENDPRRTRFGTWLRRTSLDELPQFLNVLRGNMSVVGPRPERPYFVKQFLEQIRTYNSRHRLKVGITGWAQVNGWRGNTSIEKRVEHDLYYLQNWSFAFDLRIIFLTIWSGLLHRNAY